MSRPRWKTQSPFQIPQQAGPPCPMCPLPAPTGGPWTVPGRRLSGSLVPSLEQPISLLEGGVIVPTDAPLDAETTYTVTFSDPADRELLFLVPGREGICRLDGIEGNCRMVSTGVGSLPHTVTMCWRSTAGPAAPPGTMTRRPMAGMGFGPGYGRPGLKRVSFAKTALTNGENVIR